MSHVTSIRCEIKDLESLKQACVDMKLKFNENKTTFKAYYTEKCDHSISTGVKGAYEIGVRLKNGVYTLNVDNHAGGYGTTAVVGSGCSKLLDRYSRNVAVKEAQKFANENSYNLVEELDAETGETVIRLRKY